MLVLAVRQIYRIEELSYRWAVCLLMLLTKRITAHEDFAFQFLSLIIRVYLIIIANGGGYGRQRVYIWVDIYKIYNSFK